MTLQSESPALRFRYAARSDAGAVRPHNEDSGYATSHSLAIADGLGGHAGGEIASAIAVGAIAALEPEGEVSTVVSKFDTAVRLADDVIEASQSRQASLHGMGSTLTAVAISNATLVVCHIGDSRGYLLREGELTPLTVDHTYIQQLIDLGKLTAEEALAHPRRSVVLRALGGDAATADISIRGLQEGDRILLCSDGLSGVVANDLLARVLALHPDPTAAVQALVDLALLAGAPDNVTVIVADVVDTPPPQQDVAVVVGAAADVTNHTAIASEAMCARLSGILHAASMRAETMTAPLPMENSARLWRRVGSVLAAVVLVIGSASAWLNAHWWVGIDAGHVVMGRGLAQPVLGLKLGHIVKKTQINVAGLPRYDQSLLATFIAADSRSDAEAIVRSVACRTRPPSPECLAGQ